MRAQLVGAAQGSGGDREADAGIARAAPQQLQRRLAQAALGQVDDALERQVVVRLVHRAQIRDRVADLGPFVEARAADHPVRQAEMDEALLECARLEARAHQDRDVVEPASGALLGLDLLADEARLLLVVPEARDAHALARLALGPQRLAEARAVVRDQARGGAQDVPGRAVIALQAHHLGAGEVLLEAQNVADLGAAPAVDRLVVVADAGDVAVPLRQQPQPQVLGDVAVLVLVDQNRAEAPLVVGQDLGLLLEQAQAMQQQIAEIAGVQREKTLLVRGIELARTPERELVDVGFRHLFGSLAAIFPALDGREQGARRPAPGIQVRRLDHLLQQAQLIVGVEDREVGLEPDQLGVPAQQAGAERVEGAEPQALDALPEQPRDAQDHLARRLVGEGHRERLIRPHPPGHQQVGKARGQHPGLAGAGAGEHQERPVVRLDRGALRRVERVEIVSCRARWRRQHVRLTGHGTPRGRPPPSTTLLHQFDRPPATDAPSPVSYPHLSFVVPPLPRVAVLFRPRPPIAHGKARPGSSFLVSRVVRPCRRLLVVSSAPRLVCLRWRASSSLCSRAQSDAACPPACRLVAFVTLIFS